MSTALRKQAGFTLVELAIVMIIIGLLIGGVLKGQELIANAQVTATISQIKGIDSAATTFRDVYGGYPGDIRNAAARVPNCTAAPCAPTTANTGDNRMTSAANTPILPGAAQTAGTESLAWWAQLNRADLLSGLALTQATPLLGDTLPTAPVGGGFSIGSTINAASEPNAITSTLAVRNGFYLALSLDPALVMDTTNNITLLTPSQAARFDRKMDDGAPNTGNVLAAGTAAATGCASAGDETGVYNEALTNNVCGLYFRVQN